MINSDSNLIVSNKEAFFNILEEIFNSYGFEKQVSNRGKLQWVDNGSQYNSDYAIYVSYKLADNFYLIFYGSSYDTYYYIGITSDISMLTGEETQMPLADMTALMSQYFSTCYYYPVSYSTLNCYPHTVYQDEEKNMFFIPISYHLENERPSSIDFLATGPQCGIFIQYKNNKICFFNNISCYTSYQTAWHQILIVDVANKKAYNRSIRHSGGYLVDNFENTSATIVEITELFAKNNGGNGLGIVKDKELLFDFSDVRLFASPQSLQHSVNHKVILEDGTEWFRVGYDLIVPLF